jgi:uncharacterized membrane protein
MSRPRERWTAPLWSALVAVVAVACSSPSPGPAPAVDPVVAPAGARFALPMRFVGTEPFWGARLAEDGITLSGADRPQRRFVGVQPLITGAGARWTTPLSEGGAVEFVIVPETCSDGMSDRAYPFRATVTLGGETLNGCAIAESDMAAR